jgi:hypothetical protein
MSLVLQSSGGGSVTLQEAVTASNLTITVPAVTGTMLTTASTGTVLQVVNATYAVQTDFSTASFVDTGLTATITPTSSTSRILVLVNQAGLWRAAGTPYGTIRLVRNSTGILIVAGEFTTADGAGASAAFLDSPATTSATTYKTQMFSSGATMQLQRNSGASTICLMEIA